MFRQCMGTRYCSQLSQGFQRTVEVACKMTALIPSFLVIGILCCFCCWKWLRVMFSGSYNVSVKTPAQLLYSRDPSQYVLQLQDDLEIAERTLTSISKSVTRLIQSAEKQQPSNLMKLLEESISFEGVTWAA